MKYKVGSELCQNWEAKPWSKGKDFIRNEVEHIVLVCVMEYFASIFVNIADSFKFPRLYVNMNAIKVEKIMNPSTLI